MMATPSNRSTTARRHGLAATLALAAALLWPGGQLGMVAHAQAPFETPSVLTSLVSALDRLSGVDGRLAVIALATTATTEDQARFLANAVEMLAAQHQTVQPLAAVVAQGTVIGRTPSGALIVPGAVDYVVWTERVAGFAGRTDLQGTPGSLWITGGMSPEAQRQFAASGWTVYQHVPPPWQR